MTQPRPEPLHDARRDERADQRADADPRRDEADRRRGDALLVEEVQDRARLGERERRPDERREDDHRPQVVVAPQVARSLRGPVTSDVLSGVAIGSGTGARDLDVGRVAVGHDARSRSGRAADSGSMMASAIGTM